VPDCLEKADVGRLWPDGARFRMVWTDPPYGVDYAGKNEYLNRGDRGNGLTGFIAGLSRQTVRHNVTINGLLPGSFETDRLRGMVGARAKAAGGDFDEAIRILREQNPSGRLGSHEEFGKACAFLCSVHAGFITGQNPLMDGGANPLTS
jgi:3-oxoacyl-[acyl-carrier protein] reductase